MTSIASNYLELKGEMVRAFGLDMCMGLFVRQGEDEWKVVGAAPRWLYVNTDRGEVEEGAVYRAYELSRNQRDKISSYLRIINDVPVKF